MAQFVGLLGLQVFCIIELAHCLAVYPNFQEGKQNGPLDSSGSSVPKTKLGINLPGAIGQLPQSLKGGTGNAGNLNGKSAFFGKIKDKMDDVKDAITKIEDTIDAAIVKGKAFEAEENLKILQKVYPNISCPTNISTSDSGVLNLKETFNDLQTDLNEMNLPIERARFLLTKVVKNTQNYKRNIPN